MSDPPYMIDCPWCFRQINPHEVKFRCIRHSRTVVFDPHEDPDWLRQGRYVSAPCPHCRTLSNLRQCPKCDRHLPRLAGHDVDHYHVGIAGSRGSGKTVLILRLLGALMARGGDEYPGIVPLFEDDSGYRAFLDMHQRLHRGETPGATPLGPDGNPEPIVIRLLGTSRSNGRRHKPMSASLVLYDPPGDIFESFENLSYTRYLERSSAIILTVDSQRLRGGRGGTDDPCAVIEVLAQRLQQRASLIHTDGRINRRLAVLLTRCDEEVFPKNPRLRPPDAPGSTWTEETRPQYLHYAHHRCQELLQHWGHGHFTNQAGLSFRSVHYFACSALSGGTAPPVAAPEGVVDPLLWTLGIRP